MFAVTVPSSGGAFQLGEAQVSASVVISRGRTKRADDSQVVPVQPTVLVELAETARLESGGGAVVIDPMGSGTYVPVCDGSPRTFTVRVEASQGVYQAGIAQALTFANRSAAIRILGLEARTREAQFGLVEHSDVVGTLVLDEVADLPARTVDDLGHLVG